ncbi:hypothetical protein C0992_005025 [Termitomyces sp. T32_za158]|nr:hypothetical protein C0992_005025 [Termitomyces sp. T32_za158]
MAAHLSERQKSDLHKSILDYLHTAGFSKTCDSLRLEVPDLANFAPDPTSTTSGLLVKKWTSVIRMQRKILELESRLSAAQEELSSFSADGAKRTNKDWLPTDSPKRSLTGHRDKINAVRFHPHYSILASASVDATVKIWDWETGELEKTLKGHMKSVTDCDFNLDGKLLATCSHDLFIKLWNVVEDYTNFSTLRGHEHSISSTARITEIESGTMKVEMRGHDNRVESAVFVPKISIPAVRELVAQPASASSAKVDSLAVSFVMTASRDKTIKLWDSLRGLCLWTFVG